MKKITLEEAYKRATKGPLHTTEGSLDVALVAPDTSGIASIPLGPTPMHTQQLVNAALLAHAFNHFQEAINLLHRHRGGHDSMEDWTEMVETTRKFLAKASTVEIP